MPVLQTFYSSSRLQVLPSRPTPLNAVLDTLIRGVLPPPLPPPELERSELRQRMRELLEPPVGFETPQTLWGMMWPQAGQGSSKAG